MDLLERVYSTLVVNASPQFGSIMTSLLTESTYYPLKFVSSVAEARRAVLIRKYDIIIVNAPLPDEFGVNFALDMTREGEAVVLVMVPAVQAMEVEAKLRYSGVFSLKKPLSLPAVSQSLAWIRTASDRMHRVQAGKATVEEKMEEIRLVNKAKWVLIENLNMTEEEAHRYISKQAMDKCVSKREIANTILSTYKN
ncbi:MAG: response regulator [Spirochaetales bacterium]|nr:response regulator [Candidatus Physcosoma equi]